MYKYDIQDPIEGKTFYGKYNKLTVDECKALFYDLKHIKHVLDNSF